MLCGFDDILPGIKSRSIPVSLESAATRCTEYFTNLSFPTKPNGHLAIPQMDSLNLLFTLDRFCAMKTWRHDDSIVYRFNTIGAETSWAMNWVFPPCKANNIFLKVQNSPSFESAYDQLATAGLDIDPDARKGLSNTLLGMLGQRIAIWESNSGESFKDFFRRNLNDIRIGMQEVGHMRIFIIVWSPRGASAEAVRSDDMNAFIREHFRAQLTQADWESYLRTPVKWIAKQSIKLALDIEQDDSD